MYLLEVIKYILEFKADKPGIPVLIMGDFNMVINTISYKFPPGKRLDQTLYTSLFRIFNETGLRDIWREHHPTAQIFPCYSGTDSTLSRIDMAVANDALTPLVTDIRYEGRGLSDHSPLVLTLGLGKRWEGREWKVNPFWLQLIAPKEHMLTKLREFIDYNRSSAAQGVVCDTLKAY